MILITVSYGHTACPLLFKTEESAQVAWKTLATPPSFSFYQNAGAPGGTPIESMRNPFSFHQLSDDFGRILVINSQSLTGMVYEDLELSKHGQVEQALHQARTQAEANKRGMSDPTLQAAQRLQGPAMLSPMGGMGNGRMPF